MNRVILTSIFLIFVVSCSDKQEKIKKEVKPVIDTNITKEVNATKDINVTIEINTTKEINLTVPPVLPETNMMVIPTEFIPEHVRRSTIEVVPHY